MSTARTGPKTAAVWRGEVYAKLGRWVMFAVLCALLPFGISWWHIWTHTAAWPTLEQLWPRGELLLVSVAIGVDAFGELFGSGRRFLLLKSVAGGACALLSLGAAGCFSDAQFSTTPDPIKISKASMLVFVCILIASGGCKILAEVKS